MSETDLSTRFLEIWNKQIPVGFPQQFQKYIQTYIVLIVFFLFENSRQQQVEKIRIYGMVINSTNTYLL